MKRIFTADLHIHEYASDSETTSEGISLKLHEILNAIKQMCDYAVENKISEIIFGGDLIHHNNIVHARAFSKFKKLLSSYKNIKFIAYCGNHEFGKADGRDNALDLLEADNIQIIKEPTLINNMLYIPHSPELFANISMASSCDILLSHFGLSEAKTDTGLAIDTIFKLSELKKFKLVLIGDYHTPQIIEKNWGKSKTVVCYPGSPVPITRSEVEDKRFIVFDDTTLELNSIPISGYRKYYNIEINESSDINQIKCEIESLKFKGHYVVVRKNVKDVPKELESILESVIYVDQYEEDTIKRGLCSGQSESEQFVKYMDIMNIKLEDTSKYLNTLNNILNSGE